MAEIFKYYHKDCLPFGRQASVATVSPLKFVIVRLRTKPWSGFLLAKVTNVKFNIFLIFVDNLLCILAYWIKLYAKIFFTTIMEATHL